ncbi:methyl-accepting chemotaxis protein, partial [Paenibacillus sp.]|uniref:cache domain-containing sensor histidine kinase n=1 Tax=Paenibacillus sp. TaxID=58172 RepID=UPI002D4562E3
MMKRRPFTLSWATKRKTQGPEGLPKQERMEIRINPARSIGVQLFLYFFLVIVVAVSSVGYLSYNQSRLLIETQVLEAKRLTAVQAAEKLSLVLQQYEDASLEIMLLPEISELSTQFRLYPEDIMGQLEIRRELEQRLNTYTFSDNTIASLHLLSMDELLPTLSVGVSIPGNNSSELPWFQKAIDNDGKGLWVPTSAKGPSGAQPAPSFGYARVIKDQGSFSLIYMYIMELREERLQEVMVDALGKGSRMLLLDENGVVISSANKEEIGTPYPVSFEGDDGSDRVTLGGQELLIAHSRLAGGWRLVGEQPFAPLVAGTNTIRDVTVSMLFGGVVAAIVIGWMIARRIGAPMRRLSALMKRAEDGDLSVQSTFSKRRDEIGTLATGFNEMLRNIRALVEESHQSVREVMNTAGELGEASRRTA